VEGQLPQAALYHPRREAGAAPQDDEGESQKDGHSDGESVATAYRREIRVTAHHRESYVAARHPESSAAAANESNPPSAAAGRRQADGESGKADGESGPADAAGRAAGKAKSHRDAYAPSCQTIEGKVGGADFSRRTSAAAASGETGTHLDERTNPHLDDRTNPRADDCTDAHADHRTDPRTDRRTGHRSDRRTDHSSRQRHRRRARSDHKAARPGSAQLRGVRGREGQDPRHQPGSR
jgi:hypothetical protein